MKEEKNNEKKIGTTIWVGMWHIRRKIVNILPILHVYSDFVRNVRYWLTPLLPLSEKIRNEWPLITKSTLLIVLLPQVNSNLANYPKRI